MNIKYIERFPTPAEYNMLTEAVGWGTKKESIIEEARSGTKRIILTTGPDSCDWKTGFYGKELENIADILGLDSADSLANCLKKVEVIVNGAKGFVYEIDFGMIP